jgi:predicted transcriptional regulator
MLGEIMVDILENLDYTIEILEEDKKLFLQNRDQLETESKKLESLRETYMKFNELYIRFRDNINDIIAASSDLKEIKRMYSRGEIMQQDFLMRNNQLKARIQDSYTSINEDIFPKLKELADQIYIFSIPEEMKRKFEEERDAVIKKIKAQMEGKDTTDKIRLYLKHLFPVLIKIGIKYTTGLPL